MRSLKLHLLAGTLGALGMLCTMGAAHAAAELVGFPVAFDKGVLYGTVDRHDIKQLRELYANPEAVAAIRKGQPLPSGTVLTMVQYKAQVNDAGAPLKGADGKFVKGDLVGYAVMEKRAGWGVDYADSKRNGEWEYQAFTPDRKVNTKADLNTCFACHKPHAGQDFVISQARLSGTAPVAHAAPAQGNVVAIANFQFGPAKAQAKVGQAVTWANSDDSPHQVSIAGPNGHRTVVMLKGQSAQVKFDKPGVYDYQCGLHPGMKGVVEVTE